MIKITEVFALQRRKLKIYPLLSVCCLVLKCFRACVRVCHFVKDPEPVLLLLFYIFRFCSSEVACCLVFPPLETFTSFSPFVRLFVRLYMWYKVALLDSSNFTSFAQLKLVWGLGRVTVRSVTNLLSLLAEDYQGLFFL